MDAAVAWARKDVDGSIEFSHSVRGFALPFPRSRSASAARNLTAHGAEDRGQVVHAGIALGRKHPVQAFAWNVCQLCELLES
jgi:hypothetical protein